MVSTNSANPSLFMRRMRLAAAGCVIPILAISVRIVYWFCFIFVL
jgi:hypothetical protein